MKISDAMTNVENDWPANAPTEDERRKRLEKLRELIAPYRSSQEAVQAGTNDIARADVIGDLRTAVKRDRPDDESELDDWLSMCAVERLIDHRLQLFVCSQAISEQIDLCGELVKHAAFISTQFDPTNFTSSLDLALSDAYREVVGARPSTAQPSGAWLLFQKRLQSDAVLLARVAKQARSTLTKANADGHREFLAWRNGLFIALHNRLLSIGSKLPGKRIKLARAVWELYFTHPIDRIISDEAAKKIVKRAREKHKSPGH